jgi:hypothetical protein
MKGRLSAGSKQKDDQAWIAIEIEMILVHMLVAD